MVTYDEALSKIRANIDCITIHEYSHESSKRMCTLIKDAYNLIDIIENSKDDGIHIMYLNGDSLVNFYRVTKIYAVFSKLSGYYMEFRNKDGDAFTIQISNGGAISTSLNTLR